MPHARTTLAALLLLTTALPAAAQEWTRFRGPNGQGVSDAKTVPHKWTDKTFNWKIELPGEGYGSPVAWGDKLFVVCADAKSAERKLLCLNATTGKTAWIKTWPSKTYHLHGHNSYGTTTPAVDAQHVYMYFVNDEAVTLAALNHDGSPAWSANVGPFKSSHGGGTSPMIYKGLVIVTNDQVPKGGMYAFDKNTGKQVWRLARNGADNGTSYGVPCVFTGPDGKDQLIVASKGNGVSGIDPATGKLLWELSDIFHLRSVASPVIAGDLVFAQCGSGGGGKRFVGVRPGAAGQRAELVHDMKAKIPYVPTPVVHEGKFYYITDGGQAACLDPKTGKTLWFERIADRLAFFGSPVCVNGVIYAIARDGRVAVIRANPDKFELLAMNDLGEKSYATPAVAGGRMYLRTLTHLYSVGGSAVN